MVAGGVKESWRSSGVNIRAVAVLFARVHLGNSLTLGFDVFMRPMWPTTK
jgi:hypothetical protein